MTTPEGRVKRQVKAILAKHPTIWKFWPVPSGYGSSTLDCVGVAYGRFFAIETKAPGKTLTKRQELEKQAIQKAGGTVFVIDGDPLELAALANWLDELPGNGALLRQ